MEAKKKPPKCRRCSSPLSLQFGWRNIRLCCLKCGSTYNISQYFDEIDEEMWLEISNRRCDRA